jgi:predicted DNA-binding transcriptional regulator AlpA
MTNRISKAVEEFYSSSTIAPLLDIKTEDMQDFCYQHKIKTKVYDDGNESKLFVSGKSLQDHLARSKESDQANIALKWQALKQSIYSKNNKRIKLFPKSKELPTCTEMPEGFVDTKEAALISGLSKKSIINYINRGKLEAKKIKYQKSYRGFKYAVSIRSCEDYKSKYKKPEMPEGFVDVNEAAQMLGFQTNSIRQCINRGELEAKKIKSKKSSCGFVYAVSIRSCEDYKSKYKNYPEEMPEGFVDVNEAAQMLGVHRDSILHYIYKGKFDAKKIKSKKSYGFKYAVSIRSCEDYKSKYKNYSEEIPEGFVDVNEAAQMLGVTKTRINQLCQKGELDAKKIRSRRGPYRFKYAVSIRSCVDWMKIEEHLRNDAKKVGTTYNKALKVKEILEAGDKELIEKLEKEDVSIDTAYKKIRTKKEDKMNQDNNSKLPSIDLYMLSHVIDLNTLALVYPNLRDWLAENRSATIREFIVDTIKQMDHLSKNYKHGE